MRVLVLFRGAPGCGKSTYIDSHGWRPYALSADEIRRKYQSGQQQPDGTVATGFRHDKEVWDTLFQILESRMRDGEFTVIDATNSRSEEMNRYKKLADEYRYRIYLLDMTGLPIEECKRRNRLRPEIQIVPDEAIDKMYARFETQKVPSGITVIKPSGDDCNEFDLSPIFHRPIDLSHYRKIVIIGDIHGCNTVLREYLKDGIEEDVCYLLVGDYLDRGIENADVIRFLLTIKDKQNVILLTGNHECALSNYAHNKKAPSREFELVTKPQLAEFDKKDLRQLCRKFIQCAWFNFHEKEIFVCHGGIATMPEEITYLSTSQMVKGVGNYEDYETVADTWMRTTASNQYQVFGHRNTKASPVQMRDRVFNLEGRVEFGGCLRVVELDHEGFHCIEIQNTVFRPKEEFNQTHEVITTDVAKLVVDMRNSKYITENQFGPISSFNFTRTAFLKDIWNTLTTHARGLFIDTSKMKVCCRSYPKFFFPGQSECPDLFGLKDKLQFPVTAYVKENGFLGLLSYDEYADDFRFCTKSMVGGEYAEWFKEIFFATTTDKNRSDILRYLKANNVTFAFEVIDTQHDSHIIEYPADKIVLLDIIKNQLEFEALPYDAMRELTKSFGLINKIREYEMHDWDAFCCFFEMVQKHGYTLFDEPVEGFVVTDINGFMFKIKTDYYKYWKSMRPIINETLHKGYIEGTGRLVDETQNRFYGFLRKLYTGTEDKENISHDVVTLRKMFYDD